MKKGGDTLNEMKTAKEPVKKVKIYLHFRAAIVSYETVHIIFIVMKEFLT